MSRTTGFRHTTAADCSAAWRTAVNQLSHKSGVDKTETFKHNPDNMNVNRDDRNIEQLAVHTKIARDASGKPIPPKTLPKLKSIPTNIKTPNEDSSSTMTPKCSQYDSSCQTPGQRTKLERVQTAADKSQTCATVELTVQHNSQVKDLSPIQNNELKKKTVDQTATVQLPETKKTDRQITLTPSLCRKPVNFADGFRYRPRENMKLSLVDYYRIRQIIPAADVDTADLGAFSSHVFKYLLQCVKFGGCHALSAAKISELVHQQTVSSAQVQEIGFRRKNTLKRQETGINERKDPVSKLDCIIYLLTHVDNTVASELLLTMSQFPIALPLIMCECDKTGSRKYHVFSSLMRGIPLKWESGSRKIVEHSLFVNGCRMILCVRLGNNQKGKSAILNQLLVKKYTFSSKDESGYGKPNFLDGCVEMIWMTQELCESTFWNEVLKEHYSGEQNEVLLLANLHGDALHHKDLIRFIDEFFLCSFLVFMMPEFTDEMCEDFEAIANTQRTRHIIVDDLAYQNDVRYVDTRDITADSTMQKVRNGIKLLLTSESTPSVVNLCMKECKENKYPNVVFIPPVVNDKSSILIELVSDKSGLLVKREITAFINKANESQQNHFQLNEFLHQVLSYLMNILDQHSQDDVHQGVIHLDKELLRLSISETQEARKRLLEVRRSLENHPEKVTQNEEIQRNAKAVEAARLGVEHFFRLLGCVYELAVTTDKENGEISKQWSHLLNNVISAPVKVASLLMRGQPIELLGGDNDDISLAWLGAIFNSVNRRNEKPRVFVVSIIGLQSSGKSTLLNSLFACRFPVSVGTCSRGLIMRMLYLDDQLAKSHGLDAILLIDTEGLCSPEKVNDPMAGKKDRLLATFAVGISNLTLINVLGENTNELSEILQMALIAMTRLEEVGISSDILVVQHHLTEMNSQKTAQANAAFSASLRKAADLAEKYVVKIGVRNVKCLDTVRERITKKAHLFPFHPFKDGASVNAPPSEAYHQDVVSMYHNILEAARNSASIRPTTLDDWFRRFENLWNCVKKEEDFAMRFRNVQDIYDFIERGNRINAVKRAVEDAFRNHMKDWQTHISRHVAESKQVTFPIDIANKVRCVPDQCQCSWCKQAMALRYTLLEFMKGRLHENETSATIATYIENNRQRRHRMLQDKLNSSILQQGNMGRIDCLINERVSAHLTRGLICRADSKRVNPTVAKIFVEIRDQVRADEMKHGELDFKTHLKQMVKNEYETSQEFVQNFDHKLYFDQLCDDDGKLKGVKKETVSMVQRFQKLGRSKNKPATMQLRTDIENLPRVVFTDRKTEIFEDGMISDMQRKIGETLKQYSYQSYDLEPKTKTNIHIYGQQRFCEYAEERQTAWDRKNSVSGMLEENEDYYKQHIETKVRCDVAVFSDGKTCSLVILNAVRLKAEYEENSEVYNIVSTISWLKTSETVRLQYFKELSTEVSKGSKERALRHFANPRQALETWFKDTVDRYYRDRRGNTYQRCFESQFALIMDRIQNSHTTDDLIGEATSFASKCEIGLSDYESREHDFSLFKRAVIDTMTKEKDYWCTTTGYDIRFPSQNADVMALLGCTDQCPCCGAICCGERDHIDNKDETRKHYTSHQPCGLDGRFVAKNRHMSAFQCHSLEDDEILYIGSYKQSGISWRNAKEKLYSEWKFDRHYNSEFDELMRWFFRELHQDIAATNSLLPSTAEELQACQCENLNLRHILRGIENQFNF